MPGPGQTDLQVLSSKTTDLTRFHHQQEQTNRTHQEALVARQETTKEVQRTQVQASEGPQGGRVDRDGRRRQEQPPQQKKETPEEPTQESRMMGYGRQLDIRI